MRRFNSTPTYRWSDMSSMSEGNPSFLEFIRKLTAESQGAVC